MHEALSRLQFFNTRSSQKRAALFTIYNEKINFIVAQLTEQVDALLARLR